MTIYTLSETSPLNTVLTDPDGNVVYEILTPFKLGDSETTIKRGGQTIATVQWKPLSRSTLTMGGKSATLKEVFPRSKMMCTSRIYTMPNGEGFRWKGTSKLTCVSLDSDLSLVAYHRTSFYLIRSKKSTIDVLHNVDTEKTDAFIVTWVIAEKKARDRRRARRHATSAGGGG